MKKPKPSIFLFIIYYLLFLICLALCSCLGVNVDISLNQNGSGNLALEYRISQVLDALGRLDGNERWNTIPVGRADFERTMDRLPGIKLTSFSSKEDKNDLIINAKMEFENLNSLMSFIDASGLRSSFSGDAHSGRIFMVINDARPRINTALESLIAEISLPYSVKMAMSFPNEGTVKITNNRGFSLTEIPGSTIISSGKKVSFSLPLNSVLSSSDGINVEFLW
jgi:hypothetical protein